MAFDEDALPWLEGLDDRITIGGIGHFDLEQLHDLVTNMCPERLLLSAFYQRPIPRAQAGTPT